MPTIGDTRTYPCGRFAVTWTTTSPTAAFEVITCPPGKEIKDMYDSEYALADRFAFEGLTALGFPTEAAACYGNPKLWGPKRKSASRCGPYGTWNPDGSLTQDDGTVIPRAALGIF